MMGEKPPGEEGGGAQQEDQSSKREKAEIHDQMETGDTVLAEDGNNQENSKTDNGQELLHEVIPENNEQQLPSGGENIKDDENNQRVTDVTPSHEMKEQDSHDDMVQGDDQDQNQVHMRELREGGSALDNEKPVHNDDGDKPLKNIEGQVEIEKNDQGPCQGAVEGAEEQHQQQQQHVGVKADQEQQWQPQADVITGGEQGGEQQQQLVNVKEGGQLQQQEQVGVETDREQGEQQQKEEVIVNAVGEIAEQQKQVNIKAVGELIEEKEQQQQQQAIMKEDQETKEHQMEIEQGSNGNEESHVESSQEQPDHISSQQNEDGAPLQTQEGSVQVDIEQKDTSEPQERHSVVKTPVDIQEMSDRQDESSDATKEKEGETGDSSAVDLPKFEKQVTKPEGTQVRNQTEGTVQSEATTVSVKPGLLLAGSMVDNQAAVRHPDEMQEENRKLKQEIFVSKQQADAFRVRVLTLEQEVGKLRARKIDNRSQDSLASDSDSYLKQKLGETERELDTAERKVKDLQLRLKRFAKDDQIKDEKIAQMERELKELSDSNMKLEQSLESSREANNNTATTQSDKNIDSKVCVIL